MTGIDKMMLLQFFNEIIQSAMRFRKPGITNPCKCLIEELILRQDSFIKSILGDYTRETHEERLNCSGLKLYWQIEVHKFKDAGELRIFKCGIGGDQKKDYATFVSEAESIIDKFGFALWPIDKSSWICGHCEHGVDEHDEVCPRCGNYLIEL